MTRGELARYADVKERDVDSALGVMEELGMVDQGVPVTVCNWSERQYESDDVTARTAKHRSKEQLKNVPTNNVGTDQITETETDSARTQRGTRIDESFSVTVEMRAWLAAECPRVNLEWETQKFVDWAKSATGPNAVKRDWVRAWKNWMRRVQEAA